MKLSTRLKIVRLKQLQKYIYSIDGKIERYQDIISLLQKRKKNKKKEFAKLMKKLTFDETLLFGQETGRL